MHVTIDLQLFLPHFMHTLEWNDYSKFNHVNMCVGLPYFYFQTIFLPHKLHKYFLLFTLTTLQVQMQGRSIASLYLFQYAKSVCMPTLIIRCLGCYAYQSSDAWVAMHTSHQMLGLLCIPVIKCLKLLDVLVIN